MVNWMRRVCPHRFRAALRAEGGVKGCVKGKRRIDYDYDEQKRQGLFPSDAKGQSPQVRFE